MFLMTPTTIRATDVSPDLSNRGVWIPIINYYVLKTDERHFQIIKLRKSGNLHDFPSEYKALRFAEKAMGAFKRHRTGREAARAMAADGWVKTETWYGPDTNDKETGESVQ